MKKLYAYEAQLQHNIIMTHGLWPAYLEFPLGAEFRREPIDTVSVTKLMQVKLARTLIDEEVNKELLGYIDAYLANPTLENLAPVFDNAIDTIYVVFQLLFTLNLPFELGFATVHAANLAKLQRDEHGMLKRREDGKILKPEGWQPPDSDLLILIMEESNRQAMLRGAHGAENWPKVEGESSLEQGKKAWGG